MKYNSSKDTLVIPEYGRHIQNMILFAVNQEDKEKRQLLAEGIVDLMIQMNPTDKKTAEYVNKMWTHMLKISNYKLEVEIPDHVDINPEPHELQGVKMEYSPGIPKYRHYGRYIQKLIEKAMEMEESPERQEFVRIIGSYMKTAYKQWNKDHYVSDESVLEDINIITKGELSISEDQALDYLKHSYSKGNNRKKKSYSHNKKSKNNRSYKKRNHQR